MDRFWKYKLDHVIFWIATIAFHMYTRLPLLESAGVLQFVLEIIIRNGLLALLIYVNLFVLVPQFVQRKRIITYGALLLLAFALYVTFKDIHDYYLYTVVMDEPGRNLRSDSFYNLSIALFYVSFSVALQLSREWYAQRELIRKIEFEKVNAELEYLKAQINPHFLFNSINTIYFQIDKSNAVARETLSSFSEMLRYQLYECNGREVAIEKEVGYLRNYADLQRHRKDEHYAISFNENDMTGFTIAPLLLIPFIENAFKHVSHFPANNVIRIDLGRNGDTFRMRVLNTRDVQGSHPALHQGIGLKNVQRRLELLYNGRHTLRIDEKEKTFEVDLELKINQT